MSVMPLFLHIIAVGSDTGSSSLLESLVVSGQNTTRVSAHPQGHGSRNEA